MKESVTHVERSVSFYLGSCRLLSLAGWWQMYSAGTDGSWAIDPCVSTAVWTVVDEHDEELWTIQHDPSST